MIVRWGLSIAASMRAVISRSPMLNRLWIEAITKSSRASTDSSKSMRPS